MEANINNDSEITAKTLRQAIQTLKPVLGDTFVKGIIHDLELYGLLAKNERESFAFEDIQAALGRVFGEAAPLLMRLIVKALFEKT